MVFSSDVHAKMQPTVYQMLPTTKTNFEKLLHSIRLTRFQKPQLTAIRFSLLQVCICCVIYTFFSVVLTGCYMFNFDLFYDKFSLKLRANSRNNSQHWQTTCNRVFKRTQHVPSNNVESVCTGLKDSYMRSGPVTIISVSDV